MAPAGCHTHRHASRDSYCNSMIISYNKILHHVLTISHHNMPCKNKLDVLYFVVCKFYVAATG